MPDGEVSLSVLANLADALQELTRRIGRDLLDATGPGRTPEAATALTDMRLVGLTSGSTTLRFARGRPDELELDLRVADEIDSRFWVLVTGVAAGRRPSWVTESIAESTSKVARAFKIAAPEVELRREGERVRVVTRDLRYDAWQPMTTDNGAQVTVTGRLEAVDLRSARFRIVDDVDHRFSLEHVPQPEAVAYLINHRVRAVGPRILDSRGQLKGIDKPLVEAQGLPTEWFDRQPANLKTELAKPGPALGDGVELTDEEFDDFIAMIKG